MMSTLATRVGFLGKEDVLGMLGLFFFLFVLYLFLEGQVDVF